MSTNEFFDTVADEGSENEEDYDEETGETRGKANGMNGASLEDSSEEEDDDDDEDAQREVNEGFIDDEEHIYQEERRARKRERKKRRREEREAEENLDEEDLDLIGALDRPERTESKFKRLKRGHRDEEQERGVTDIFADDDLADDIDDPRRRAEAGEFDDFIEDDEFPDEVRDELQEELEVSRKPQRGLGAMGGLQSTGLDEADAEDMRAAFGDGTEYDWALELQEAQDEDQAEPEKPLELKDVFEPSQLKDKMLTDEDNLVRATDVPERYQIARKPFTDPQLSEEEASARAADEALWVSNMLWPKKRLDPDLLESFRKSVGKVLHFMNVEDLEPPFIFQHRRDYLIHAQKVPVQPDRTNPDALEYQVKAEKLFTQSDLWEILELDLKYRALAEKKEALKKAYGGLEKHMGLQDETIETLQVSAVTMEEVQDLLDYLHFQYAAELKDVHAMSSETNGVQKRAKSATTQFEKLRAAQAYNVVRGFGITADAFAQSALEPNLRSYTEDPTERPEDMADQHLDDEFPTGSQVLRAAKAMFAEELAMSPRMRKLMRQTYFTKSHFDCMRTEKGKQKIHEDHPYYEFKYLRNQTLPAIARRPELYLRMLKAEEDGLVQVKVRLDNEKSFKRSLVKTLESDNFSDIADGWNVLRRETLDSALNKLEKIMVRSVKEHIKSECENQLARNCRETFSKKLDQAPHKPKGMLFGTEPRVLAFTNGNSDLSSRSTYWAWVDDGSRSIDTGAIQNMILGNAERGVPDGPGVKEFCNIVKEYRPDVIAVSGMSVDARTLYKDIQTIVEKHDLKGPEYEDDDGHERRDQLEILIVNDEVARLYHTSIRAQIEYPDENASARYCIAIGKYLQSPLKEYIALKEDIVSIKFDPNQDLIPLDKLKKHLETAMVDIVNLVGVDINDAMLEPYTFNLLPYVCGLGPRKAMGVAQAINRNGGNCNSREELVGDPENNKVQAVGPTVWMNCASFICIEYDVTEPTSDYLDSTRIHPEDYDLARKMAADGMELDEEDVKAEQDEHGPSGGMRRLVREERTDTVNMLVLEMYADQLESSFHQKKRATLETIRAELQQPYEELRRGFSFLSSDETFTMFTGETRESLVEGMVLPVVVQKIFNDHLDVRLDCGIEGSVSEAEYPSGIGMQGDDPKAWFTNRTTYQARLNYLDRRKLTAQLSLRPDQLSRPYKREFDKLPGEWDQAQEDADKREETKRQEQVSGRAQRVIKHPLFRIFNAIQAEEYLGPQSRGDCVIRPSSKGNDHLAVTWKVDDNVYQHIDILELDKENEFSVGKRLKIGGKYTYSDLDELIVNHVKAMAKKVDEIMTDERFQTGSKTQTEQWLTAYMEANPKRAMYAFCINRDYPGYFLLCFKASQKSKQSSWPVKIVPNAFQLQKNDYPSMMALKNGFKTIVLNQQQNGRRGY